MQCPECGCTDLEDTFKWCPECRSPLHHGQSIPSVLLPRSDALERGHDFGKEEEHVEGDGQNQQCQLSYRDEHGTLLRQQTQPTIHSRQPDIEGGSTFVDPSTESESKSPEGHRQSANSALTSPLPTTSPTARDRGLPHRASASAPYSTESSGSEDKPGTTKPTATQHGKQPGFADNVGFNKGSTERDDSRNVKKDGVSGGESVRSQAELGQGDVYADQTGSYDGVNDTKKEVRQSNKSSNHGQMTCGKDETVTHVGSPSGGREPVLKDSLGGTGNVQGGKDSKTSNNGTQILSRETVESPTRVKSGAEGKELGSRDPLNGTGNTGDGKEGAKGVANTLKQVEPEDGVTVIFHVVLASNLNIEEEHMHIRAEGEDLGDFKINCVDMKLVRGDKGKNKKKPRLFQGQFTLTIDRARKGIKYKYVIIKKKVVLWEELIEFQPPHGGVIVDRFLFIPDKYLERGATWHQFDGVSYIITEKGWWDSLKGWFRPEQTAQNRTTALLAFLPKWRGFVVGECEEKMKATEAVVELDKVVDCLTNVGIQFSRRQPERRKPPDFNIDKVLMDHLEPKMKENAAITAQSDVQIEARSLALVSSLAIVLICKQYKIELRRELVLSLLRCLSLAADPAKKKCTIYEAVLENFSEELRE